MASSTDPIPTCGESSGYDNSFQGIPWNETRCDTPMYQPQVYSFVDLHLV